jgi:dTDP-4-dehydrorhamnose reductase
MKILITGSNGLLGQKIVNQLAKAKVVFLATSLGENRNSKCNSSNYQTLDITNPSEINNCVNKFNPTHIINTAAVTNVDFCEDNIELCQNVNVNAVKFLFEASKTNKIQFIHLSTDFIFDGKNGPYSENDTPNPLSIYATSKYDSEQLLINDDYTNWSILRTIIVYGEGENLSRSNIVVWAKSALAENKSLTIVDDQFRSPTWADDLAWACIRTADINETGIFHISGPTVFSIYELVCEIADFYGNDKSLIQPIKSKTLNQKAPRPPKTGFVMTKANDRLGYVPKTLKESLKYLS